MSVAAAISLATYPYLLLFRIPILVVILDTHIVIISDARVGYYFGISYLLFFGYPYLLLFWIPIFVIISDIND